MNTVWIVTCATWADAENRCCRAKSHYLDMLNPNVSVYASRKSMRKAVRMLQKGLRVTLAGYECDDDVPAPYAATWRFSPGRIKIWAGRHRGQNVAHIEEREVS